jgi:predicted esterase
MGVRLRSIVAALSLGAIAVSVAIVAMRRGAGVLRSSAMAPPPSVVPSDARAPLAPPVRVRHDSVRVPLSTDDPARGLWQMHEAEPLIEPDAQPRPVTVLLHGMCADSSWTCDWLQYFQMAPQWQICPRAPNPCRSEPGYSWGSLADTRRIVERSLAVLRARHGARVRDDSIVLAGFSLGAYAVAALVRDLARLPSPSLRVRGILAQGARVHFAAADVRALGARVALAAGDLDGAAPAMRVGAAKLRHEGVDATYASLGHDESHFTSVSTGKTIAELIDWCRAE